MKKLLSLFAVAIATMSASGALISTNLLAGVNLISTNRMVLFSVEVTGTNATTVDLYDCDSLTWQGTTNSCYSTNAYNSAYAYRVSYLTNYVSGPYVLGYGTNYAAIPSGQYNVTNYYTNAGMWTLSATNAAATNKANALASFVVGANQYAVYTVDALFSRGVIAFASSNVSIVLNYRTGF